MRRNVSPLRPVTGLACALAIGAGLIALSPVRVRAQDTPEWAPKDLLAAAKKEGNEVVVYGSMNEQEALPYWNLFQDKTGIKVQYVRSSDTGLLARIAIERKAGKKSWDIIATTAVNRMPSAFLAPVDLPEGKNLPPEAIAKDKRWYGVYANYNTPAYNTKFVKPADLPKSYEEFAQKKEWAGKVAIDNTDGQWLAALYEMYGEAKGKKIAEDIAKNIKPVLTDGHLAMARSVGAGEYWVALNNYTNLAINVKLKGGTIDYWALDPVALFYGQVGVSVDAPHPKTAILAANYMLGKDAQKQLTVAGRIPARKDITPNPPDTVTKLGDKKVIVKELSGPEDKKWQKQFTAIFAGR
ncbi:MAG TPA: ABC transporter substrate-binding protein [Xanthobacteraceae bacterium]|jgi:iron(III) transport system substrate-binding protein|nr:ABC transporter substrate-binding protein [Xanthobacteraceae bacterium]